MIHKTAIVDSKAKLAPSVKVGPYSNWSKCRNRR